MYIQQTNAISRQTSRPVLQAHGTVKGHQRHDCSSHPCVWDRDPYMYLLTSSRGSFLNHTLSLVSNPILSSNESLLSLVGIYFNTSLLWHSLYMSICIILVCIPSIFPLLSSSTFGSLYYWRVGSKKKQHFILENQFTSHLAPVVLPMFLTRRVLCSTLFSSTLNMFGT